MLLRTRISVAAISVAALTGSLLSPGVVSAGPPLLTKASQLSGSANQSAFETLQTRVLDTRTPSAVPAPIAQNTWRTVQVTGVGGIPAAAVVAVQVAITVLGPTNSSGKVIVAPVTTGLSSDVVFYGPTRVGNSDVVTNSTIVALNCSGAFVIKATSSEHLVIDVHLTSPGIGKS